MTLEMILQREGVEILQDSLRIKGILSDYFPRSMARINVIAACAQIGIAGELLGYQGTTVSYMLIQQRAWKLARTFGFSDYLCLWAVLTWAQALHVDCHKRGQIPLNFPYAQTVSSTFAERLREQFDDFKREPFPYIVALIAFLVCAFSPIPKAMSPEGRVQDYILGVFWPVAGAVFGFAVACLVEAMIRRMQDRVRSKK